MGAVTYDEREIPVDKDVKSGNPPSLNRAVHYVTEEGRRHATVVGFSSQGNVNLIVSRNGPNDWIHVDPEKRASYDMLHVWIEDVPFSEEARPYHWSWPDRVP